MLEANYLPAALFLVVSTKEKQARDVVMLSCLRDLPHLHEQTAPKPKT